MECPRILVPKQKVQHIPAFAAGLAVQLGVAAVAAADGDELLFWMSNTFGEVARRWPAAGPIHTAGSRIWGRCIGAFP